MKTLKFVYENKSSEFLEVEDNQVEKIIYIREIMAELTGIRIKIIVNESEEL